MGIVALMSAHSETWLVQSNQDLIISFVKLIVDKLVQ